MPRRLALVRVAALALIGCANAVLPASAQTAATAAWPERPIRVVLPFPPGGPSDIVMRLAAEKMQAVLKQPIVIDNKPGAGGNLGSAEVARAAPDGYTWLFGPDSLVTVNPHVYKQMPFKVDELRAGDDRHPVQPDAGLQSGARRQDGRRADREGEVRLAELCLGRRRRAGAPVDGAAAVDGRASR